jgi:hypothetical protein
MIFVKTQAQQDAPIQDQPRQSWKLHFVVPQMIGGGRGIWMFIKRGTSTDIGGAILSERCKIYTEIDDTGLLYQSTFIKFWRTCLISECCSAELHNLSETGLDSLNIGHYKQIRLQKTNFVSSVRDWTIPTERPTLVSEVSANFCW